jgi:hypothetical protein
VKGESAVEDLRLLDCELLIGQNAALVKLTELLELLDRISRRRCGCGRRGLRGRRSLLGLSGILLSPLLLLTAIDTTGNC